MMLRPTTTQLLELIRTDLAESVLLDMGDPRSSTAVLMSTLLMGSIIVRLEYEDEWIRQEIDLNRTLAQRVQAAGLDTSGEVGAALIDLDAANSNNADQRASHRRYAVASELLSRCIESVPRDHELWTEAESTLDLRLDHEAQIAGGHALVGRS